MKATSNEYILRGIKLLATAAFVATTLQNAAASDDQTQSAVQMPALLGGVALRLPAAAQATTSPDPAADASGLVERSVQVVASAEAEEIAGVDPIQTSGIVPGVFGSVAIPMRNFPVAGRWRKVYGQIGECTQGIACGKRGASFAMLTVGVRDKKFLDKLATVNRVVNTMIGYRKDKEIYGGLDYWATPAETLARGIGDCEDFAILKMAALIKAGVPAQSMSLVVLQDRELKVFHAVLSIATQSGNFILDNLYNDVRRDDELKSYVPLYSFSTDRAWIHGGRPGSDQVAALSGDFTTIAPGEGLQ
ncbi:transglutaminase-like cysteine peptidase [Aminobacter sp. Piv2-1]|uniref:transglutaminase-like cysteine peptidase n=1 Tax=Aminobacter sp. Piv2-1 TaxID=3031122 RepID=UPI0030976CEF